MRKGKWKNKVLSILLSLILLAVLVPTDVFASGSYEPDRKGSVTIELSDIGTKVEGTAFALYKVGSVSDSLNLEFYLTDEFAAAGIDLNTLQSAADQKAAAGRLAAALPSAPRAELTFGTAASATFGGLEPGAYLICQSREGNYGRVDPYLVFLPYTNQQGTGWDYDITTNPKGVRTDCRVNITKYVKYQGEDRVFSYSFYAALFEDQEYTRLASEVVELKLDKSSVTTAVLENLKAGTYYLAETDRDGNVMDTTSETTNFTNEITAGGLVELTSLQPSQDVEIINHIKDPGQDPLDEKDGQIIIDKRVVAGSRSRAVTDTFYFTLFTDEAMEEAAATKSLKLRNESSGKVTFSNLAYGTYYIAETDRHGTPVNESFDYGVSIEGEIQILTSTAKTAEVKIINDLGEEQTQTNRQIDKKKGSVTNTTVRNTGSVKTGDNTVIMFYVIVLIAAASIIAAAFAVRKRKHR